MIAYFRSDLAELPGTMILFHNYLFSLCFICFISEGEEKNSLKHPAYLESRGGQALYVTRKKMNRQIIRNYVYCRFHRRVINRRNDSH